MWQLAIALSAGAAMFLGLPARGPGLVSWVAGVMAGCTARSSRLPAAACLGFAWTQLLATGWLHHAWPCTRDREEVDVTGRVAAPALEREGRTEFDFEVAAGAAGSFAPRRIRVAWYEATDVPRPGET